MTNRQREQYEAEKRFLEHFDIPFPYLRPGAKWHRKPDPNKILSLSDLHEPFSNQKVLALAEAQHKDAAILLSCGDLGDYYSKSRFRKEHHVEFKKEVLSIFRRLEWMATHWRDVRVMVGNHDNRPEKALMAAFGPQTDLLILTESNLLERLASYFDNVQVVGQQLDGSKQVLTHLYQMGDQLWVHGEISRKAQEAVLARISEYFHQWGPTIGLKPYRVILQGHNHRDLRLDAGGEYWFGLPTASDPYALGMQYIYGSKLWGKPPTCGFSIIYQERNQTDINRSNNYKVPHEAW